MAFDFNDINSNVTVDIHLFKLGVDALNECINDFNTDCPEIHFDPVEMYVGPDNVEYIRYSKTIQDFQHHWEYWLPYFLKHPDNIICLIREGLLPTEDDYQLMSGTYNLSMESKAGTSYIVKDNKIDTHTFTTPFFRVNNDHKTVKFPEVTLNYKNIYNIIVLYSTIYAHLSHKAKEYGITYTIDRLANNWMKIKNPVDETIDFLKMLASEQYDIKTIMSQSSADTLIQNIMLNLVIHNKLTSEQAESITEQTEYSYKNYQQHSLYNCANLILEAIKQNK